MIRAGPDIVPARHWPGAHLTLVLLLPVIAAALLAGWAALGLAGTSKAGAATQPVAVPSPIELPLEAGDKGDGKRAALGRGGFALAAIETSRRKMRASQRPPAQPLNLTVSFVPVALARPLARRRRSQQPLRPSRPPRPFLSQGPPSRKTS